MHADTSASQQTTPDDRVPVVSLLTLKQIERQVIEFRLQLFDGNKSQAAKSLGVSLKTIYNKLEAYRKVDEKRGQSC